MDNLRTVTVDNQVKSFEHLKEGEVFTLTEPTGELVGTYIANSVAYLNDNDVWQIDCTEVPDDPT